MDWDRYMDAMDEQAEYEEQRSEGRLVLETCIAHIKTYARDFEDCPECMRLADEQEQKHW